MKEKHWFLKRVEDITLIIFTWLCEADAVHTPWSTLRSLIDTEPTIKTQYCLLK